MAAACLLALAVSGSARAGTDPEREWFTLVTPHFAVHSYDGGEALARRVADQAEHAASLIDPLLGWTPEERVHVVVVDDVDAANGFALVVPYDTITILSFPPPAGTALSDADDWLQLLVFHEYTHIAHLDNATGVPRLVNTIMGKSLKPNQAVPRWLAEGIAVWVESRVTGPGRLGGARFEMFLRTAAAAGRLPDLGELTGTPLQHPRGTSWYLYGGYLIDYIARHAGPESIRRYATAYGRRLIPYALNTLAKRETGKTLGAWYDDLLAEVRQRSEATLAEVRGRGVRAGERRTTGGETKSDPHFSPDGTRLAYVRSDGHEATHLVMAPVDDPDDFEPIIRCDGGCGDFTFARDGRSIIMSSSRYHRRVNYYADLERVPVRAHVDRRGGELLTRGYRARDPVASLDGERVYISRTSWGETWIEALDPRDGRSLWRWDPPARALADQPTPSADGRKVYVALHHDANRDIWEVDTETGAARRLTYGRSVEHDLSVTADGRWLLYVSDATGIHNIYARDLVGGATWQLTDVETGAYAPEVSPDGETLVYSGWTVDGSELYTMPFDPEAGIRRAVGDTRPARPVPVTPKTEAVRRPYTPLPTLLPRTWLPTYVATSDASGPLSVGRIGLTLSGHDATERLGATLSGEYDVERKDFAALGELQVGLGWPDLDLSIGRYTWDRRSFFDDRYEDYREEVFFATGGLSLPLPDVHVGMSVGAAFTADISRAIERAVAEHSPYSDVPHEPAEGFSTSLRLSWSLSNVESYAFSISPMRGTAAALVFRLRHPAIGSDRTTTTVTYRLRRYLTMPWLEDHALALRLDGGWTGGERGKVGSFSLGGVPDQNLMVDLINETQAGAAWLRGFEPSAFHGRAYHLGSAEYRLPLLRGRRGLGTLPAFAGDVALAVFADVGVAYSAPFSEDTLSLIRGGLGAELRVSTSLFFGFPAYFRLGYARGLGAEGIDHVYLLMGPAP